MEQEKWKPEYGCSYMAIPGVPCRGNTIEGILDAVCDAEGVSADDIRGRSRVWKVCRARHLFCWAAVNAGYGYGETGRTVGRDRTTALHSKNVIEAWRTRDRNIERSVATVWEKISPWITRV
jgi:chromosomal replication initiation ATPase DnaA